MAKARGYGESPAKGPREASKLDHMAIAKELGKERPGGRTAVKVERERAIAAAYPDMLGKEISRGVDGNGALKDAVGSLKGLKR
jgi:hypothetical protein